MIILENNLKLDFSNMGLFKTESTWSHPHTKTLTYELIFCLAGEIMMYEDESRYTLHEGDLLLLNPNILHGGFADSTGITKFYWLHFRTDNISAWNIPKLSTLPRNTEKDFREIMHYSQSNNIIAEMLLAKLLLEISEKKDYKNKIAFEVREYVRINADKPLTVSSVASHFRFSEDYISKLFKNEFGHNLKSEIIRQRLSFIESLLVNTDDSIKEIARKTSFEDENTFVKFFKYHEKTTPTLFRKKIFKVHMNNH